MSFKRFDNEDIVISSDGVSTPAWSNNAVELKHSIHPQTK